MPLSNQVREKILTLFEAEGKGDTQALLRRLGEELGDDGALAELLLANHQERMLTEIGRAQQAWFGALGWWLARVLMWSSFVAGAAGASVYGAAAADPLTWALLGAAGYYAVIQLLAPWRLAREQRQLEATLAGRRQALLDIIARERQKPGGRSPSVTVEQ